MRAKVSSRVTAWLIDLLIVFLCLFVVNLIYHPDVSAILAKIDLVMVDFMEGKIDFGDYIFSLGKLYHQVDKIMLFNNIINVFVLFLYFVILPYFNEGRTVGKQLQKIEVKSMSNQKLSLWQLFVRNLIINGLFYLTMVVILTLVLSENLYFIVISALGFIQLILILVSIFMACYSSDHRSLHDIVSRTWVASFK